MEEGQVQVLYAKNPEGERAPASLVKLMTLYLALESVRAGEIRLSDVVLISPNAATADRYRMGLRAGERVTLETLLGGVAIASANDAAVAVAEAVEGSVEAFVARMNARAQEIGLVHTRFANPHGLPGGEQYATAADLALLALRLLADYPEAGRFLEGQRFVHRGRVYERHFSLFQNPGGILALKTGYTGEAGYNLAVVARKSGKQLLVVLLGAGTRGGSFSEAARLLNLGFKNGEPEPPRALKSARRGVRARAAAGRSVPLPAASLQLTRRPR
jgi:D-alanyl-D-alanine carboxypeptidase